MASPVKFLLVDDVEDNLVALEALLQRDGLEIFRARSGTEALELLLVHGFALALIDVQMPGMSGFELAELMRGAERSKHIPIIFVTAGPREPQWVFKGYETGAVDFLFKPIDSHILKHKVETFFQLHVQKAQLANQVEERESLVRELQETLRLNEMFIAALGHDLRNPLTAMTTTAELMIRRDESTKTVDGAKRILSSGTRMAQMIEQLLDLARARLGSGIPITRSEVDLRALAERLVVEVHAAAPGRRVELEVHGDVRGHWDEPRLSQVLSNLIGNALHHGHPSEPVRVCIEGRGRGGVALEVTNAGAIPPAMLPHLFDPFRSGRELARRGDGLGLGLYIVDQIVTAHEGTIQVRSSEASGTHFEVILPAAKRDVGRGPAGPAAQRASTGAAPMVAKASTSVR